MIRGCRRPAQEYGQGLRIFLCPYASECFPAIVRADNFEIHDWKNTGCINNFNWTNFVSKMNGATVDMTVSYSTTNVFTMTATITTNEATPSTWNYFYTSNYTGTGISLEGNIKVALSVDHSWLDITEEGMATVAATVSSAGYATFCSAYALDFTDIDVKAYKASVRGGNMGDLGNSDVILSRRNNSSIWDDDE